MFVTYSLGKEIKRSIICSKVSSDILELLSRERLVCFVNESVKDMNMLRETNPNVEWKLSVDKIIKRMDKKELDNLPTKIYELKTKEKENKTIKMDKTQEK